jgi:hypothetical protein
MKPIENIFILLIAGGLLGMLVSVRMNAAQAMLPAWYISHAGDPILMVMSVGILWLQRSSSTFKYFMIALQLIEVFFLPLLIDAIIIVYPTPFFLKVCNPNFIAGFMLFIVLEQFVRSLKQSSLQLFRRGLKE